MVRGTGSRSFVMAMLVGLLTLVVSSASAATPVTPSSATKSFLGGRVRVEKTTADSGLGDPKVTRTLTIGRTTQTSVSLDRTTLGGRSKGHETILKVARVGATSRREASVFHTDDEHQVGGFGYPVRQMHQRVTGYAVSSAKMREGRPSDERLRQAWVLDTKLAATGNHKAGHEVMLIQGKHGGGNHDTKRTPLLRRNMSDPR